MIRFLLLVLLSIAVTGSRAEQKTIEYPEFQRRFMAIIYDYSVKYPKLENELQKSSLMTERFEQFQRLKGDPKKIKDWVGVLASMGTSSDGKAYVVILLSPKLLTVSTWNNSLSDYQDRSLIPQSSPIYGKLSLMKVGNVVKFSGRLKRLKNLTEEGKMVTPDFLFIFSDIEKIGESAMR